MFVSVCLAMAFPFAAIATSSSSKYAPLSTVDPKTLNFLPANRPEFSSPGSPTRSVVEKYSSLPTNSWGQNLLYGEGDHAENNVHQIPYVIDVAGSIVGTQTHIPLLLPDPNYVMLQYDSGNSMTLGAVEGDNYDPQHQVMGDGDVSICNLFLGLQWSSPSDESSKIQAHIARGSPYSSMVYYNATPRVLQMQSLLENPLVDATDSSTSSASTLICGIEAGVFSDIPVMVEKFMTLKFTNDLTWLVFFSEPTMVECSNVPGSFELRSVEPMLHGMVRVAMTNNCTTGTSGQYCEAGGKARDQSEFMNLLIDRADVYPTSAGDIDYIVQNENDSMEIKFDWKPALMSDLRTSADTRSSASKELITFAVPHQQNQMKPNSIDYSSNELLSAGSTPSLHGNLMLVSGNVWSLESAMYPVSFDFKENVPREEMRADIEAALQVDLLYEIPENYMYGAGDTYFPGKMLAKLGRVLLIADNMGYDVKSEIFQSALLRLKEGTEVWFNGSAAAPFLYDSAWGGLASCGCYYDGDTNRCNNVYPDCPALSDAGQNFGFGFYNDHHFHLGYHIYAAAVIANFDSMWAKTNFEHILLYIRDIANPSRDDDFFTTFRHKDWYLGFSWASGVVMANNAPYMNGRNEESSSEAVAAYEAVALFGQVCAEKVFQKPTTTSSSVSLSLSVSDVSTTSNTSSIEARTEEDDKNLEVSERIRDLGRVLVSTEIIGAQTFWHVQAVGTENVTRIYPEKYEHKVVGMLWTLLAQMQTWFGTTPYLCYGIQLIPITPVVEDRDTLGWVQEMLPLLSESCESNQEACDADGWSVAVYTSMATVGEWLNAWTAVQKLDDAVFESAGGNGHSRTNTLWYIATHGGDDTSME